MNGDEGLRWIDGIVQAELCLAETSLSDGPAAVTDIDLPFDAAAVQAYEVRLTGLRDAVLGLERYEGRTPALGPTADQAGPVGS